MSNDVEASGKENPSFFRPFTRESLAVIEARITEERVKKKELKKKQAEGKVSGDEEDDSPTPNRRLGQGRLLPPRMRATFPNGFVSAPINDVDGFYHNQRTFVAVNKSRYIFRFSATNALWILSPFNPVRRLAIKTLLHPMFSWTIFLTILYNCFLLMMPVTPQMASTEIYFVGIYTLEFIVKVIARGFILQPFTYLRDPWNWLDFTIVITSYVAIGINIGDIAALRAFRLIRALNWASPGLQTVAGAIGRSIKNLRDVLILTIFSLSVYAVIAVQVYMGILTQRCVKVFPDDGSWGNVTHENWENFCQNETNWYEENGEIPVCGNATGSGQCEPGYVCLQGYGSNPNYGYTSFDNFGWAFLSMYRLMTQDYWENLYRLVLRAVGPWHAIFFGTVLMLCSFYLLNLILAIVAVTYYESRKQDLEDKRADEDDLKELDASKQTDASPTNGNPFETSEQSNAIEMQVEGETKNETADKGDFAECISKGTDFCCIWECWGPWREFQKYLSMFIFDPFVELFIVLCIVLNTLFMALDHHDMDIDMERILRSGNYFFVAIYVFEALLKILAVSPKNYFRDNWNIFDFIIVVLALLEMGLEGIQGLSVLRLFRLLRVFKLAKIKWWPMLNHIMTIMVKSSKDLANLTLILCIIIFAFAVLGMHLFGKQYLDNIDHFPEEELPRWNFTDFLHSFMIVFRALCGEWIESMWDCMLVGDVSCIAFFVGTVIIGNFVMLKLFLAMLLSNFDQPLQTPNDKETNSLAEASSRICRFIGWLTCNVMGESKIQKETPTEIQEDTVNSPNKPDTIMTPDEADLNDVPANCCAPCCYKACPSLTRDSQSSFGQIWTKLRQKTWKLIENKYFETVILFIIFLSSLALAMEDVHLPNRPMLQEILYYMDFVFTGIFFVEMLLKWLALGCHKYFTSGWCWLDFIVVVVLLINLMGILCGAGSIHAFKIIRSLRALSPLRVMSRMPSMKVVVDTLVHVIPSFLNVLLVSFFFWLVFAIMGVQLFAGKFYKCVDENGTTVNYEIVPDRQACILENYTWVNSPMNFDHVGNAYLCLLQVATFKGWIQIMNDAIDSREIGNQPIREVNIYMYLYFVYFIIFGSFLTLNLFVGMIVNKFNEQRKRNGGSLEMFMTEDQKRYYRALKKMGSKKPVKAIPRPKYKPQALAFDIVTSSKFEFVVLTIILLNIFVISLEHYQQSEAFSHVLDYLSLAVIVIFTLECLFKICALRFHYFTDPWNLYDFVVVILLILGLVLSEYMEMFFLSPTLLTILRVARVGRVLGLVKRAKGIRTLLFTLSMSLPAILNICVALFLVMYIFAIFGMSFFMHVKNIAGLDDVFNFETFSQSMLVLFQISTLAGWDGVLSAITNEEDCEMPSNESPGNCGSSFIGITYMLSYLAITFFIVLNMYIAVILEYFSEATEEANDDLTDGDYDMFYVIWQRFDPEGTQHIRSDQLSEFLDALKPPFSKTNRNSEHMDIPVQSGDKLYCVDILDAVTKDFFARQGRAIEDVCVHFSESKDLSENDTQNKTR